MDLGKKISLTGGQGGQPVVSLRYAVHVDAVRRRLRKFPFWDGQTIPDSSLRILDSTQIDTKLRRICLDNKTKSRSF